MTPWRCVSGFGLYFSLIYLFRSECSGRVCTCVVQAVVTWFSTALLWIVLYCSCDRQEKGGVVLAADICFCILFLLLLLSKSVWKASNSQRVNNLLTTLRRSGLMVPSPVPLRCFSQSALTWNLILFRSSFLIRQVDNAKVLHYVGAGIAFPTSMLFVCLQSALTYRLAKTQGEYNVAHLRLCLTLLAFVALVLSILFSPNSNHKQTVGQLPRLSCVSELEHSASFLIWLRA